MTTTNLHLAPPPTKTAIVIELDVLDELIREFLDEFVLPPLRTETELQFSLFLLWLQQRQEKTHAEKSNT